ncbi:MAG: ImmA/IrrE family metallo-endopeptidase [Clostridiales bacterium]|nr:ImmA/IrrE family metallo-endopeptidase [Clostridiales bacterium]
MNYKKYQQSRDAAWQIIIDQNINALPIKIVPLCRELGIQVKLYEPQDGNNGCSQMYGDTPVIKVDKNCTLERQRFTTAHELGHILLGHVGRYHLANREPSPNDNEIEQAANVFASRLLAPACVLHELRVKNAEEIAQLCGISLQSAEFRFDRLILLEKRNAEFIIKYGRGCFYLSPLERQVCEQFKDFISQHK